MLIDVSDFGTGIPTAILSRLFKRVAHGSEGKEVHGVGLGLYIAERVMALHEGAVEVVRTGSGGTTIRLAITQADFDE